jgi:hypothetical protein
LRVTGALENSTVRTHGMASSGKKKTTMAKLTRERRLRERRLDKQARKNARKHSSAEHVGQLGNTLTADGEGVAGETTGQSGLETVPQPPADG